GRPRLDAAAAGRAADAAARTLADRGVGIIADRAIRVAARVLRGADGLLREALGNSTLVDAATPAGARRLAAREAEVARGDQALALGGGLRGHAARAGVARRQLRAVLADGLLALAGGLGGGAAGDAERQQSGERESLGKLQDGC